MPKHLGLFFTKNDLGLFFIKNDLGNFFLCKSLHAKATNVYLRAKIHSTKISLRAK